MAEPHDSEASAVVHEAELMQKLLASMGITSYDPAVTTMLLHHAHAATNDLLADAHHFAQHAKRTTPEAEDLRLAAALKSDATNAAASDAFLEWIARERNRMPLPPASQRPGVQLPKKEECLLAHNYQLEPRPPPAEPPDSTSVRVDARAPQPSAPKMTIRLGAAGSAEPMQTEPPRYVDPNAMASMVDDDWDD